MKINNFNGGTLVTKHNHLEYIVNRDLCHYTNLDDIQQELTKKNDLYLDVKDIEEEGDYLHIIYNTDKEYRPFVSAKRESKALKLSLLDYLLEINPLQYETTVLNPSNIFFRNIKDIKIGYRGHDLLPKVKMSNLEQYKILIMSMLSRFSYDKFLKNKFEVLSKENNTFFHKVNNADSLLTLQEVVRDELSEVQTKHLLEEKQRQKRLVSRSRKILLGSILSMLLLFTLISMAIIQNVVANKEESLNNEIAKVKVAKEKQSIYENLYNGDLKNALKGLKNNKNFSKADVVSILKNENAYEELLKYEPKETEYVIEKLYKEKNVDVIRELAYKLDNNEVLKTEMNIIDSDPAIFGNGAKGHYKEQNIRLAEKALSEGYVTVAEDINKDVNSKELQKQINNKKIADLKDEIKKTKDKAKIADLKDEIEKLEK
ncbi:hypothetical protein [Macrococcus armenti]|uniref:hypothetical protein n=1 Tax=Macrococcus armenti TaxID=2875764 RepID=UPI001CCA9BDD|nr:hypothetical protein [Macrococcus armenti]UBH09805.1 hypothetical protein LAU41_11810 [Macrococcus armenti]